MNHLESEFFRCYLDQLSFRVDSSLQELQLLQKHIGMFQDQLKHREELEKVKCNERKENPPLNINNKKIEVRTI